MLRYAILLTAASGLMAQHDAESMHVTNVELTPFKKTTLQFHSRLRTRDAYREFFQARFGPILQYAASDRVTLTAGYYYTDQHYPGRKPKEWEDYNRYFGGTTIRLVNHKAYKVDWRTLLERFHTIPGGDYTRVRTRGGVSWMWGKWSPLVTMEGLYGQDKWTYRAGAGLNRRVHPKLQLGFGYELRQAPSRALSHIIVTNVLVQPQRKE